MNDNTLNKHQMSLQSRLILMVYGLVFLTGLFFASQSIKTAHMKVMENAYHTALNEQFRIGYAIKKMVESRNFSKEEQALYLLGAVRNSADDYSNYYKTDASYRVTSDDVGTIYSNISDEDVLRLKLSPENDGDISYFVTKAGDKTLIVVTSYIKIYQSLLRLDYIQNSSSAKEAILNLSKDIASTLFIAEVLLFLAMNFTISKALRPLNSLKNQAMFIAKGDFKKRLEIVHNDEVGQLAMSFNHMSDAVEEHVNALWEAARLKELFASNLAHEIKTPITSIVAYSDYATQRDLRGEELHGILNYIKKEGQRISSLADKILKWSSLNSQREVEIKPLRSQRIIEQVLYTLSIFAHEKNQRIVTENHTEIIFADEALLISLIVNLCKNALNASDKGEAIYLSLDKTNEDSLIIKVKDFGVGIEQDELKKITEPFYMVDKSRDRAKGGSGLGLSLCLAITEAHNGTLDIESVFGEGTCVSVKLPQTR